MKGSRFNGEYAKLVCAFEKGFGTGCPVKCIKKSFPPGYRDGFHNHDFPQVWYCLDGSYTHCVGDRQYDCAKGTVITVPPGTYHFFQIPEDRETEIFYMDVMYDIFLDTPQGRYVNAIANLFLPAFFREMGIDFPVYRVLSQESQAAFELHASWLVSLGFHLHQVTPNSQICEKLEDLFSLPEFALPEASREKAGWIAQIRLRPMLRALTYLNLHYPEKIVEEDILGVTAVCRTNLYRDFKCLTGYPCFVYLQRLRMNHAGAYMTHTAYSLSHISDLCGFSNQQHMSRIFSSYTGKSPRAFRAGRKAWVERNPHRKQ